MHSNQVELNNTFEIFSGQPDKKVVCPNALVTQRGGGGWGRENAYVLSHSYDS